MTDSILDSVKLAIGGINPEFTAFDADLIIHINSVFSVLTQLGVGPDTGYFITSNEETWTDFLGEKNQKEIEMVKIYVAMRVKLLFDPPANSFTIDSIKKVCDEFEWRLNVAVETPSHVETS